MHGQADTDTQTRTLMEKTDSYGKDGQLRKRRAAMEKTDSYGKDAVNSTIVPATFIIIKR